jgi:hypothetical protein
VALIEFISFVLNVKLEFKPNAKGMTGTILQYVETAIEISIGWQIGRPCDIL